MEEKGRFSGSIDKIIDYAFSLKENKIHLYLGILVIMGFILRLIAMINIMSDGDSAHYIVQSINFFKSGLLTTWHQSAGLWYFLTSMVHSAFGASYISARILTLIAGTLTIIAIFLFAKELFRSEKVGLIAAAIFTFYSGHIKLTEAFMHTTVLFFLVMCLYYLLKAERTAVNKYYLFAFCYIAIAQMLKSYVVVFIPGIVLFLFANRSFSEKKPLREAIKDKKIWKRIAVFALIMLIAASPILIYNYLLYKDKGIVDRQFTTMLHMQNPKADALYSWDAGYDDRFQISHLFGKGEYRNTPDIVTLIGNLIGLDIFIALGFFFAVIYCLIYLRTNEFVKRYFILFILILLPPMIYLNSMLILTKHMVYFPAFFAPLIAFAFFRNMNITKKSFAILTIVLLLLALFIGLSVTFKIHENFYYKMHRASLYSFGMGADANSLIVQDPRIYYGYILVAFPNSPVITINELPQVIDLNNNLSDKTPHDVYFIEQVNAGNKTAVDDYFEQLKNQTKLAATMSNKKLKDHCMEEERATLRWDTEPYTEKDSIKFNLGCWTYYNPLFMNPEETPIFRVYKTQIMLSESLAESIIENRYFFLHPVGYYQKDPNFNYDIHSGFDNLLNKYAFLVMYLGIIMYFALLLNVFIQLISDREHDMPPVPNEQQ